MIAVLTPEIGNPYHYMVFQGINKVLETQGYHMLFHSVQHEDKEDPETLANIRAYRPAGYIVLRGAEGPRGIHARQIAEEGVPLVGVGKLVGIETNAIVFENRLPMKLGTDYVIELGHRRLAHLAGPNYAPLEANDRQLGFVESLLAHDIRLSDALIAYAGETAPTGYQAALDVLRNPETRPTAVLCFNDIVAMGVYRAAHELGLDIPRDLSVVGFDGIEVGELMGPPLTTIDIFPKLLGENAAELLLQVIRNETGRSPVMIEVEPKLLERASVRRIEG
jgi:DNA-binding LacI/PurR family transcriptional regulator